MSTAGILNSGMARRLNQSARVSSFSKTRASLHWSGGELAELPRDPLGPGVDDHRRTERRLLARAAVDVPANDEPRPGPHHRIADRGAAEAAPGRGEIDRPLRRRVAHQH